jgi:F-type H+-transporting ATPase subunit delta
VTSRAAAARYARALLDVVLNEHGNPEQVERELTAVADLLGGSDELRAALTSPAVPASGKRGIVEALILRLAPSAPVGKLLLLLADRDRLALVPDLVAVYRERLMDLQQVVRAEVTTAMPLSPDRAAVLQQRLAAVTGRRVIITTKEDPSIIGGLVARVGGTVYDASLANHLDAMRQRLLQQR